MTANTVRYEISYTEIRMGGIRKKTFTFAMFFTAYGK